MGNGENKKLKAEELKGCWSAVGCGWRRGYGREVWKGESNPDCGVPSAAGMWGSWGLANVESSPGEVC